MSDTKRRKELTKYIDIIEGAILKRGDNKDLAYQISELKKDILNDFFTVLVVGEFKRGKSTFVNALLGEKIMLTNVLPETATIQAIMYGEDKIAEVVYENNTKERGDANQEFFLRFSPKNLSKEQSVKYIKVSYPCELLRENVVLVDTPGVQDLDEQRVQVTYDFLPKANAVIMLLDATSPMKRSEKEFIEEHLMKNGVSKVIFILNRMDLLDVDCVDIQEHVENSKNRIRDIFSEYEEFADPIVVPVSAYQAMCGIEKGDECLIEDSNIRTAISVLKDTLFSGDMERIKLDTYKYRLEHILIKYKLQFQKDKNLLLADSTQLNTQLCNVMALKDSFISKNDMVEDYVENEIQVLMSMVDKSLDKFERELIEDVKYEIERYMGSEFKSFIERDVPHIIKKKTEYWLQNKGHSIDMFFGKLENKLSTGLSKMFNSRVFIDSQGIDLDVETAMHMQAEDVNGAMVGAGAIVAVGVIAMSAMGLGAFAPLMSMAVLPSLRNQFLKEELKASKDKVLPLVKEEIDTHVRHMRSVIEANICERADELVNTLRINFNHYLDNYQQHIERCIEQKNQQEDAIQMKIKDFEDNCVIIDKIILSTKTL